MWYDTQSCFCVFRFHSLEWYISLMFLFFLPCLFSGRDRNMGNNAITISFSLLCHGYAFVSSAISHGRITKSHNNVLSRPKMYLYTHFKEKIHFFDALWKKQTAYFVSTERKSFYLVKKPCFPRLFTKLYRENFFPLLRYREDDAMQIIIFI